MNIAVVGNRVGWKEKRIHEILSTLLIFKKLVDITIVSGGADGVDTYAQTYAKKHGFPIKIIYPSPHRPTPERYFERNQKIIDEADELIAFNKKVGAGGTQSTINRAFKKGIPVVVLSK